MKSIILSNTNSGWISDFIGDQEIFSLFGTTAIPTAFGKNNSFDYVKKHIEKLNPGYSVTLK